MPPVATRRAVAVKGEAELIERSSTTMPATFLTVLPDQMVCSAFSRPFGISPSTGHAMSARAGLPSTSATTADRLTRLRTCALLGLMDELAATSASA